MTEQVDLMSPDASPGQVIKTGVRRVNNMPIYLIGGALTVFLIIMVLVATERANDQSQPNDKPKEKGGSTNLFAAEIVGNHLDGIIPAADRSAPPPVPALSSPHNVSVPTTSIPIARPENLNAPPQPPGGPQRTSQDDEMERIRMAKMQMFEEAVKAKTGVQIVAPRSRGSSDAGSFSSSSPATREEALARLAAVRQQIDQAQRDDPTAVYQARLRQIQASGLAGGGSTALAAPPQPLQLSRPSASQRYEMGQFAGSGQGDRWKLDSEPEAPRSPYELRAGFVIPATLISGINSDLPGQIMAQVSQNVYDTPTGKYLLVPQGSRLVGSYSSDVAYGQSRVLIAWQRIVFPDGKAMDIGAMPGADGAGYSGFKDQINNHYLRIFGSAFLMSGVTAAVTYNQDQGNKNSYGPQRAGDALSEALGQQLGQVTAQMIAKNLNIAPTLEIRPGYRFNVIVIKDMTFSKPYRPFDY